MPSLADIPQLAQTHHILIYVLLFIFSLFGGPTVALFAGFLAKLGYLQIVITYVILLIGDYIPDTFYYFIGKYARTNNWAERLAQRFESSKKFITDKKPMLENLWKNHTGKMMLFAKQAYGLAPVLLVSAGIANIPYRRFITWAFSITMVQYVIFLALGYVSGYSYAAAGPYINYVRWSLAAIAIIFIVLYTFAQKRVRTSFMKTTD